jgi:hypothetical protein
MCTSRPEKRKPATLAPARLVNVHILKEAAAPSVSPPSHVALRSTLRCKNPLYIGIARCPTPQTHVFSFHQQSQASLLLFGEQCFNWRTMALGLAQEYIRHTTYTEPTMKTIESLPLDGANGVRIEILERSDTTLVIRWVEPGRCHYGEQRWRRRSAHTSGTCAVSRRKIRRGDAVFKPAERPAPSNAAAMISVETLCSLVGELQAA